jgi:FlaA1/EpsC-like NDP-sugar epimerase
LVVKYYSLRNRYFLLADILILCLTPTLALFLRVDAVSGLARFGSAVLVYTVVALGVRLPVFYRFELYRRYWRYASVGELVQIAMAVLTSTAIILVLLFAARIPALGICEALPPACGLPRSIPFIDALLVLLAVGGVRLSMRLPDLWRSRPNDDQTAQRVLVMGAGDAGTMIVKEMRANPQLGLAPVGFVDDDPQKWNMRIHGVPVMGDRHHIPQLVDKHGVSQVIIAMPTAPGQAIRDVVGICEKAGVQARTMPGMYELLDGTVSVGQLRNVQIEDLLRREPVRTDFATVQELIRGRRVLITGAGGSIGGELCRQVLRCGPERLILVGHGENAIFDIYWELRRWLDSQGLATDLRPVVADIRFADRVQSVFCTHHPQLVFHAAAHKHVPLMEENPGEAITNNVLGTGNVLDAAQAVKVERFVMISTDKAVNPTSIMGASKRVAELLVHQVARKTGLPYVAVRFGNVLGSRGSVVWTFKEQIAAGGPITVTHPKMRRFFMTIPEAVQLVLQAATMGHGGEVFILDMGEPVKIVDLAHDLVTLSGLEVGRDVEIVYSGARPGEKLSEELFVTGESYRRTRHEKIFIADNASSFVPENLDENIRSLVRIAQDNDRETIIQSLLVLVPEFEQAVAWVPEPSPVSLSMPLQGMDGES